LKLEKHKTTFSSNPPLLMIKRKFEKSLIHILHSEGLSFTWAIPTKPFYLRI